MEKEAEAGANRHQINIISTEINISSTEINKTHSTVAGSPKEAVEEEINNMAAILRRHNSSSRIIGVLQNSNRINISTKIKMPINFKGLVEAIKERISILPSEVAEVEVVVGDKI